MKHLIAALILTIATVHIAAAQTRYAIPVKIWAYGVQNAPSYDDIKNTLQNLNRLNAQTETGFSYYLVDLEFVKKKKFDNMGFGIQMPWQSITRHEKHLLNIALVGGLHKSGDKQKGQGRTGVCFSPTGSVTVTKGEDMSVVTHEVGHFLGLKHQFDLQHNIMSYTPYKTKRGDFTSEQKKQMLDEAAKMKNSKLWQLSEGEPVADEQEPDSQYELATPIRSGKTQQHTFHRIVNNDGETSYDSEDWLRFSFSKKTTLDNPKITVESAQTVKIELLDNNRNSVASNDKDNTLSLNGVAPGSYFIKITNLQKSTAAYSITLRLNND